MSRAGDIGERLTVLLNNAREENLAGLPPDPMLNHAAYTLASEWDVIRRQELRFTPVPTQAQIAEGLNFPAWIPAVAA